ncbi:PREDICTED: acyl-coenzyme A amino acid N-acyltransferase 1-like [Nanorana parkeri]|uniref:acyl-coenzyme A amino acid N-acyltransferase 1-like n=1 Tax=Nanorana parkeri TaxID=125878 RepID=UPI0008542558|nr:PREDICTED: acyl-coenzyme A amino acid N-acyltransferase 1-like [Nanorana parkeri]
MVNLQVTPETGLADEHVHIKALGLKPHQLTTIRLTLHDDIGNIFQSRAFYKADGEGQIDLDSNPALGGNYEGVYPMGLLWSLKPQKPFQRPVKRHVKASPFLYTVDLFTFISLGLSAEPQPTCSATFNRWHIAADVQRTQIHEGRVRGTIFSPTGEGAYPGIIDMFGGGGGLAEYRASLLASRGFVVFALAYFGYEDLPRSFQKLELEYFEEATDLLLKHPKVAGPQLGVLGVSKGAEIALLLASYLPKIGATVSINGTSNVYGSTIYHKGKVIIDGTPYKQEKMVITKEGFMSTIGLYEPRADSLILVERAAGEILFLAGGADQYYNSQKFALFPFYRLKRNAKTKSKMITYPGAGHLIEPPGFPFAYASHLRGQNMPLLYGGEMIPHCQAEESIWKEIQAFFREHLGLSSNL